MSSFVCFAFLSGLVLAFNAVSSQPTTSENSQCPILNDVEGKWIYKLAELEKENEQLKMSLQTKRCRRGFEVRELRTLNYPHRYVSGIARGNNLIYVFIETFESGKTSERSWINVYEDKGNFTQKRIVDVFEIGHSYDMAFCSVSNGLYILEQDTGWMWKMSLSSMAMTQWLHIGNFTSTLSVSSDGNVLLLNETHLNIFRADTTRIRSIRLFFEVSSISHVVQLQTGTYFISHLKLDPIMWVVSEVSADGVVIKQFPSSDSSFQFGLPVYLSLDPVENRIFVVDSLKPNVRVIEIDTDFQYHRVVVNRTAAVSGPRRLHYNATDGQLMLSLWSIGVTIYEVF